MRRTQTDASVHSHRAFLHRRDMVEFWLFCAAVFLAFLTNSTTAYFSVIFAATGMSERAIGEILATPLLPVPIAISLSGPLIQRFSALRMVFAGQLISLASFVGLQLTLPDPVCAGLFRLTLGLGFGVFFAAGMVYAKSKLHGPRTSYLFGVYAVTVTSPVILSPAIAEWYLQRYGIQHLFYWIAIPLAAALLIMATLSRDLASSAAGEVREDLRYWQLLRRKSLWAPNIGIGFVGIMWGFVVSFMALFLYRLRVPSSYFFSSCMLSVIVSRIVFLRYLSAWLPREALVGGGVLGMAVAYGLLAGWTESPAQVVVCGVIFGTGYSLTFPVLSVWISGQFRPEDRGKPVALFGAIMHVGVFGVPLVVGQLTGLLSLNAVLAGLTGIGGLFAAVCFVSLALPRAFSIGNRSEAAVDTAHSATRDPLATP